MVSFVFNAQQFEPRYGGSGGLPAGIFPVIITNSELAPNKNNDGGFMALTLTVTDGPMKGATMIDRLNLHHTNPETVRIANQQLAAYCYVTGQFQWNDTSALHNHPFQIQVGPQKTGDFTEVKKLMMADGSEIGKPGAGPQGGQNQPQGGPVAGFGADNGGAPQGGGFGQPQQGGGQPQGGFGGFGGGQPQGGGQPGFGGQPQGDQGQGQSFGGGQPQQGFGGQPQGGQPGFGGQPQGGQPQQGGWSPGGGAPAGGQPGWGAR